MRPDSFSHEALTARIAAIDLTGPVLETSAALTRLHRDLAATLGPTEARRRFDAALGAAVAENVSSRPTPFLPAA